MIKAGPENSPEHPPVVNCAPKIHPAWTPFQAVVGVLCGGAFIALALSTADLLYRIPGERYLFTYAPIVGQLGFAAALVSPIILALAAYSRRRILVLASLCLICMAIVGTVRFIVLLSYL